MSEMTTDDYAQTLKAIDLYGYEVLEAMKKILIEKGKGNSNFISTLNYRVVEDVQDIRLEFIMEDYYKWVNNGRGPGKQPPLDVITKWCDRKGIPPKAAFPIARKIGLFGLPSTDFTDPFWDTYDDEALAKLEEASAADISLYIKTSFED